FCNGKNRSKKSYYRFKKLFATEKIRRHASLQIGRRLKKLQRSAKNHSQMAPPSATVCSVANGKTFCYGTTPLLSASIHPLKTLTSNLQRH
ncbi:hypothetical protein LINGRAHAP2_LOCUS7111, partial [Linum grandiflorum]